MLKNCLRSRLTSVLDQSENVTIGYSAPKTSEYPFSERSNIKKKDYGKKKGRMEEYIDEKVRKSIEF